MTESAAALPVPPVPAGADLTDLKFMPLQVARLRRSKSLLICKRQPELAFYMINLWTAAWHSVPAGSLEDDDDVLADAAMCSRRRWKRVRTDALRDWVLCSDGWLYQPALADLVTVSWAGKVARAAKIIRRIEMESGIWDAIRRQVFERDDFTCQYCRARGVRLECDHVIPLSKGGVTALENLTTACFPCNRSKGAKSVQEWRQ